MEKQNNPCESTAGDKDAALPPLEAVMRENRLLRAVIDSLPIPIYAKDLGARKILTNLADMALMGVSSAEEALGKTDEEIYPTASAKESVAEDRWVLETGKPILHKEFFGADAQRVPRWFLVSKVPLFDEEGRVIGLAGLAEDITERKRMEEALRESEARYRRIVEMANEGIWQDDADSRVVYVNRRMAEMLGYTPEEMLGRTSEEFVLPEDLEEHRSMEARRRQGLADVYQRRLRTKSGGFIHALISAVPLFSEEGVYVGSFAMITDITERVEAEQALARERRLLRTVLDNLPMAVYAKDLEGRKILTNKADLALAGLDSPEEMLGKTDAELYPPEVAAVFMAHDQQVLSTGQPSLQQEGFKIIRGRPRWLAGSKVPLFDEEGRIIGLVGVTEDITERKRMEEALRESEARYRRLAENAADLIYRYEFTPKRGFTYVNPAATAITGYTPEEHYADPDLGFKLIHPEDRPLLEAVAQGQFEPGKPLVFRWVRKDGQIIWTEQRNIPIYDEAGNLVAVEGIARDITERKRMEEALRESEARYRRIVETAEEGVLEIDAESRITFANRRLATMLGYTPKEMLGRSIEEFIFPEDLADYHRRIAECRRGLTSRYERRFLAKNGRIVHGLVSATPILSEAGDYLGSFAMITDITERVEAEQALARERRLLRTVLDNLPIAVYAKDLEGRKILTNKADLAAMGATSEEEVLGKTDAEVYLPELAAEFMGDDRRVLATGQSLLNKEDALPDGKGGIRWILGSKLPLYDDEGRIIGLVGFAQDITERKRAEEERLALQRQLLQAQKLESLGMMAGGIAHDFNNLLMGILGNLDLALMDLPPGALLVRESIERAMQAGRRAADLARQMLAYSGRGRFVVQRLNLGELVEENLEMLRTIIPPGVAFALEINKDIPLIEADPGQVQQVMVNLVTNAAEAIGEQAGVVRLATGVCHCDEAYLAQSRLPEKPPPGEYVYLEVVDTGCGMDAQTLERMFDPFFSTKMVGRGLGMAAVYGIVLGHHGAILVQSAPGQGTTVRVLFPAVGQAPSPQAPSRERAAPSGVTVLVADDEPMVLRVAKAMLERLGYRVLTAESGQQALEAIRAHGQEIDAVLLDLTMPRMDGIATLEALRGLAPELPVILSSGYNEQEIVQRYGSKGLTGFIQKPYSLERLAEALERALSRKAPQGET